MTNEIKVGIFVVCVIAAFFALVYEIGDLNLTKKDTYSITMVFTTVEGLKPGSQLELAGVQVGSVRDIDLNRDYTAVVTADIFEDVRIPIDSTASIATKGILGDKIIVVKPGMSKNTLQPEGNLARTSVPPSLDSLLEQLGQIAGNLSELSASLNATLGDQETVGGILANFQRLSEDSAALVAENREDITALVSNMRDVSASLVVISRNFTSTSEDLRDITGTVRSGEGTIGKLVYDDRVYDSLQESLESLQKLTSSIQEESTISLLLSDPTLYYNLVAISDNVKVVTDNLAAGKGSLGKLMNDDELYTNLNEAARNVNQAAQGLGEQVPITVMGTVMGFLW
ncbi:MAG TPA: MlaD family protein [Deltaproteobacteria bacterium]|nr:MlaD family protein [Deltaproteobacteria bacterium]